MAMIKFAIVPDNSSYAVTDGKEVVSTQLDGGAARYRRDVLGATSTVDVSWVVGTIEYKYIRSFFRAISEKGAKPFLIDLILDESTLTEHKAYFVPGSMKLTGQKGLTYWVSAQLEVTPIEVSKYDANYVYLYNEFGPNFEIVFPPIDDKLNNVVNNLWPQVL